MDMVKRLNDAIAAIEATLDSDINVEKAAQIACVTKDSFMRFFSYMTGMSLNEYIRRRRLTLAADELQNSNVRVLDVAVKYGWDSADAFTKAFVRQHGITPTQARSKNTSLKMYPPASFHMMIKGAREMDFRIIEMEETEVFGLSKQFDGVGYKSKEELRHIMWAKDCEDGPGKICSGEWNEPGNHSYDGVWYGIWQNGSYKIARGAADVSSTVLEKTVIPSGTYAAFTTKPGGLAWEELPKLNELILDSWLPSSEYTQKNDLVIEVLHLWTDHTERNKKRYYEIWIPVERKQVLS